MIINYQELDSQHTFNIDQPFISLISSNHWFIDSLTQRSVYFGYWIATDNNFYKLIERINIDEQIQKIEVINEKRFDLISKKNKISLYLDSQGFNLHSNQPIFIKIDLDNRKLYETKIVGDNFKIITQEKSFLIINDYGIDFNIFYEGELRFVNRKINVYYDYDHQRKSTFYQNEINQAFEGYVNYLKIFSTHKKPDFSFDFTNKNKFAYFVLRRILSLYSIDYGFKAGLPWFPQRWFRDELISLLFLNFDFVKEKIFDYYLTHLESIWQFNKEENTILSADTLPLLIVNLNKEKIKKEKNKLLEFLDKWVKLFKIYENDLPPKSTWMDTLEKKRALEIDFLYYLSLIRLDLLNEAKKFKIYIKNKIYSKKYPEEEFLTPNLFFCYFLDKNFFEQEEWETIFDNLIKNNYLDWGGFSSLSITHPNFQKNYTGEDPTSYHQGDSWFWLNNLAYYVLKDLNKVKYKFYIKKLKNAAIKNLLKMGAPGYMSELSSAEKLTYEGSPIQLWSLSSLYYNLKRKDGGRSSIG